MSVTFKAPKLSCYIKTKEILKTTKESDEKQPKGNKCADKNALIMKVYVQPQPIDLC